MATFGKTATTDLDLAVSGVYVTELEAPEHGQVYQFRAHSLHWGTYPVGFIPVAYDTLGNLIVKGEPVQQTEDWTELIMPITFPIEKGKKYRLGYLTEKSIWSRADDDPVAYTARNGINVYPNPPQNFGTPTQTWTKQLSLLVDYTPTELPLSVAVSPESASLFIGQKQTFTALPSGGTPPYTIEWIDNITGSVLGTGETYEFTSMEDGTFEIYAHVTDNVGATADSNVVPITVTTLIPVSGLYTQGRYIKETATGNTIILRGVNQAGFLDRANGWWNPEGGGYTSGLGIWNPDAVKYNLDGMKRWGCNVLRLHTTIQWWLENTNNYRQHIRDVITWAGERGIYVIFEPYSVMGGTQHPLPFPPYIPTEQEAIIPSEQAFIDYWTNVANELKDLPNVLFELYNEPHYNSGAKQAYFRVAQDCINAIRATGADQLIIIQWGYGIWVNMDWPEASKASMDWVEDYPLNDPLNNIVYSFHNYRGDFHRTTPTRVNVWEYDDIKSALQACMVDYVLNTLNKPVLCGEIGANMWETGEALTRELAYFSNSLTIYNEWDLSYIAWIWTIPAHMKHGLLQNGYVWLPPPTASGDVLIEAIGVAPTYKTLTISASTGGTTTPAPGSHAIAEGQTQQVTAVPDANYQFVRWELDGITRTENPISVMMDTDHSLHAVFEYVEPPPVKTTINGIIRNAETGNPIPGATVTCNGYADITEIDGSYEFTEIPVQPYTLAVTMTGYETQTFPIDTSEGGTFTKDFDLRESAPTPKIPWLEISLFGIGAYFIFRG